MVEPTAFGMIFASFLLALWLTPSVRHHSLLLAVPMAAVMQAPAVIILSIGNEQLGITPFNLVVALAGLSIAAEMRPKSRFRWDAVLQAEVWPWLVFFLYSSVTALVLPWIFSEVTVNPLLRLSDIDRAGEPNKFGLAHVAQAVNNVAIAVVFIYSVTRNDRAETEKWLARGIVMAIAMTLLITIYQRGAYLFEIPLHKHFWASNPNYIQSFHVSSYGPSFRRTALPFIEPSYASVWFASVTGGCLAATIYGAVAGSKKMFVCALLAFFALLSTFGSSGLGALFIFTLSLLLFHLIKGIRLTDSWRRLLPFGILAITALAIAAVLADRFILRLDSLDFVRSATDFVIRKFSNFKSNPRYYSTVRAVQILLESYGVGVGAGSTRSSSYFVSLLANVGLLGLMLFLLGTWRTGHACLVAYRSSKVPTCFAIGAGVTCLIGVGVAISDQSWPVLWVFLLYVLVVGIGVKDARNARK